MKKHPTSSCEVLRERGQKMKKGKRVDIEGTTHLYYITLL